METKQALEIIEQALELANSRGVFKLQESAAVLSAYTVVKNKVVESERSLSEVKSAEPTEEV